MDRLGARSPFPPGFFDRLDESSDDAFYAPPRLVTHIDDAAIAEVGRLYRELAVSGHVLDLMSSWVSHFDPGPQRLTVLGMNDVELAHNPAATARVVHDLNVDPRLPFAAGEFDAVTCCVSIDYLVHPLEVFADVVRVLRPNAPFICTFSNRCFPTKAIKGWLATDDSTHTAIVRTYFELTAGFGPPRVEHRNPRARGDPLYAVWAYREGAGPPP